VLASAVAELSVRPKSDGAAQTVRVPLGMLGSDHAGYLSWDLEPLRRKAIHWEPD
jgi:hypothetical protein